MDLELELVSFINNIHFQFYCIGWTCCNVVSQQWLDKKRSELNPYLLLELVLVKRYNILLFSTLIKNIFKRNFSRLKPTKGFQLFRFYHCQYLTGFVVLILGVERP